MERKRKDLEEQGVRLAAISFDPPAVLRSFADRAGIGYPLLSDPDSKIIRAFGILNTSVPQDHEFYGIPNPGEYLVNADGTVRAKFFENNIRERFTAGRVLVRELHIAGRAAEQSVETDHLELTSWASDQVLRGGNRVALGLDIALGPKMHVYAPGVKGYIAVDWEMEQTPGLESFPVEYPDPESLHLPAIGETVPVYQGSVRFLRDVMIGQPDQIEHLLGEDGKLLLRGTFRYQACDDKVCYLPQTVELEWRLDFEQHDRQRAPEEIRRPR
ncbi:MAG: redoxin domain-containing protein [Acidobacteria bacterium]|nr:redoxin domain-containing protein [Acidobacteriota bacterium]